jgi:hypothetical protein
MRPEGINRRGLDKPLRGPGGCSRPGHAVVPVVSWLLYPLAARPQVSGADR